MELLLVVLVVAALWYAVSRSRGRAPPVAPAGRPRRSVPPTSTRPGAPRRRTSPASARSSSASTATSRWARPTRRCCRTGSGRWTPTSPPRAPWTSSRTRTRSATSPQRWRTAATPSRASAPGARASRCPTRRPPCFFNPAHGPSAVDVDWAPPGGQQRQIPVCPADADRLSQGAEPDVPHGAPGHRPGPLLAGRPGVLTLGVGLLRGLRRERPAAGLPARDPAGQQLGRHPGRRLRDRRTGGGGGATRAATRAATRVATRAATPVVTRGRRRRRLGRRLRRVRLRGRLRRLLRRV